jgi:four helix bundle protein
VSERPRARLSNKQVERYLHCTNRIEMPLITRFEDLRAWQRARELAKEIHMLRTNTTLGKDFSLSSQVERAADSVALNIAEGFGKRTPSDARRYYSVAHGSVAEVQSALYLARDRNHIDDAQFSRAYGIAEETSKMIAGLMHRMTMIAARKK